MLIVIDGAVYNSEEDKVSLLIFQNERKDLMKALAAGDDIFNTFPKGTPMAAVEENIKVLNQAKRELMAPPEPLDAVTPVLDGIKPMPVPANPDEDAEDAEGE